MPEADVLDQRGGKQSREIDRRWITPLRQLLERDRAHRQEHAEKNGHDQKQQRRLSGDQRKGHAEQCQLIAKELDGRTDHLEEKKIRQSEQADGAVSRIQHHGHVAPHAVDCSSLPSIALTPQNPHLLRHLRPAHWLGNEDNAVRPALGPPLPMHAHDQLHVFADRIRPITARFDERFAIEEAERARDDQQRIEKAEGDAPAEKCAQIFDRLKEWKQMARRADFDHTPALHLAVVDHANDAAGGDRRRILEKWFGHVQQ